MSSPATHAHLALILLIVCSLWAVSCPACPAHTFKALYVPKGELNQIKSMRLFVCTISLCMLSFSSKKCPSLELLTTNSISCLLDLFENIFFLFLHFFCLFFFSPCFQVTIQRSTILDSYASKSNKKCWTPCWAFICWPQYMPIYITNFFSCYFIVRVP